MVCVFVRCVCLFDFLVLLAGTRPGGRHPFLPRKKGRKEGVLRSFGTAELIRALRALRSDNYGESDGRRWGRRRLRSYGSLLRNDFFACCAASEEATSSASRKGAAADPAAPPIHARRSCLSAAPAGRERVLGGKLRSTPSLLTFLRGQERRPPGRDPASRLKKKKSPPRQRA